MTEPGSRPRTRSRGRTKRKGSVDVGRRVRELRERRGFTLLQLARAAGLSSGYLSQVERDRATASTTALSKLSEVLDVPVAYLFEPGSERLPENFVVRRRERRAVIYPGSPVHNELLVPDLRGKLEAVFFHARPGMKSPVYKHDGEDFCLVIKGRLRVTVEDDVFVLDTGDSMSFPSHVSHSWEALRRGAEVVWVVTPPSW